MKERQPRPQRLTILIALTACLLSSYSSHVYSMEPEIPNEANRALSEAVKEGDIDKVQGALNVGASPNCVIDNDGNTALMEAVGKEGEGPMVKLLIEHGADVNHANNRGFTAFMLATNIDVARLLIEAGADVNHADNNGDTALIWAADEKDEDPDMVKLLIEHGADVNRVNNDGKTALIWAAENRYRDIVRLLIDHGATLPSRASEETEKIIRSIFDTNELAYEAARGNGEGVLEIAIAQPGMINNQDAQGFTALHWAAAQGHADIVVALLDRRANFRLRNAEGLTPYQLAERNRNEMTRAGNAREAQQFQNTMDTITNFLTQFTAPRTLMSAFCQMTGAAPAGVPQAIVAHNLPQVAIRNPNTALLIAVANGSNNGVTGALERGANVNYASFMSVTPLMVAARRGNLDVVKLLIERGAHINQANSNGLTALSLAAGLHHIEVAWFLLEHGSTLLNAETLKKFMRAARAANKPAAQFLRIVQRLLNNIRSIFGVDPLAYAAATGDAQEIIKLLLSTLPVNSSLLSMRDARGMTPLHWAAATGNAAIVNILLEHGADWGNENVEGLTAARLAERNRDEMTRAGDTEGAQRMQAVIDAIAEMIPYLRRRATAPRAQERSARPPTRQRRTATERLVQEMRLGTLPQRPPLGGGTSNL